MVHWFCICVVSLTFEFTHKWWGVLTVCLMGLRHFLVYIFFSSTLKWICYHQWELWRKYASNVRFAWIMVFVFDNIILDPIWLFLKTIVEHSPFVWHFNLQIPYLNVLIWNTEIIYKILCAMFGFKEWNWRMNKMKISAFGNYFGG